MYGFTFKILVLFLSFVVRDCICEILWRSAGKEYMNQTSLCTFCGTKPTAFVEDQCSGSLKKQHVWSRCCLDSNNETIGVDLSNCSITSINVLDDMKGTYMSWINLANNSNLNCSNPEFSNSFEGFKVLNKIILPSQCPCPGKDSLWNESRSVDNSMMCSTQKSTCDFYNGTVTSYVSCPANSVCSNNGPGFYECLCEKSWFGYRCLTYKNGIPLAIILGCIAGGTILIIIPIVLVINRRKRMLSGYIFVEGATRI